MFILYFVFGISLTLNFVTIIAVILLYKKFFKDNPLSVFYNTSKKEKNKNDDIISKLKTKKEMEFWDL